VNASKSSNDNLRDSSGELSSQNWPLESGPTIRVSTCAPNIYPVGWEHINLSGDYFGAGTGLWNTGNFGASDVSSFLTYGFSPLRE